MGDPPRTFDDGVRAYDEGDYDVAFEIFRANAGTDVAAMRNVALMLRTGQGADKDSVRARLWMQRAALAGLPTAQADYGEMLLTGDGGPADAKAALPWLQLAADAGHPIAQFHLGEIYQDGEVVPQDLKRAREYYAEAAARGVTAAGAKMDALSRRRIGPGSLTPPLQGITPPRPEPDAPDGPDTLGHETAAH
ncbi:MAG TPA: tetratricopeptide repeat protein [Rhizomicrobium sp.]